MSIQKFIESSWMKIYTWIEKPLWKYLPFLAATLVLLATVGLMLVSSIEANNGHLVYALDDPYIHMAIGKNLFEHGVWGTSADRFSASSSSLLWPILTGLSIKLFGTRDSIPLVWNILFALVCIVLMFRIAKMLILPNIFIALIALPVIYIAPFPGLILTGMEHIAHLAFTFAVIYILVRILLGEMDGRFDGLLLTILIFFLSSVRYEGVFLGMVAVFFLIITKNFKLGLIVFIATLMPMVIFGFISVMNGWHFIPNPILLKADVPSNGQVYEFTFRSLENLKSRLEQNLEYRWLLSFSLAYTTIAFFFKHKVDVKLTWLHLIYLGMFIPHLIWSGYGWFYRYEMYLIAVGLFIELSTLAWFLWNSHRQRYMYYAWRGGIVLLVLFLGWGFFSYRNRANRVAVQATTNIYEQQYQMAKFLGNYYAGQNIAINDIGAISYYTDVNVIDLWGLANLKVSDLVLKQSYTTKAIEDITRNSDVQVAIIYDSWFQNEKRIPTFWERVGQWRIQHNVVCGDDTVSIYAVAPGSEELLIKNLRDFAASLPEDVIQSGRYVVDGLSKP